MIPLLRFGMLLLAIILIPWIAASPPPWHLLSNSGWVQAIGSIIAIIAGFAYVGLQNHWQGAARARLEREYRRYIVGVAGVACDSTADAFLKFSAAQAGGYQLTAMPGRDHLDIVAEELLGVTALSSGKAEFTWKCRQIGHFSKQFSSVTASIAESGEAVTEADVQTLKICRNAILAAWEALKPLT